MNRLITYRPIVIIVFLTLILSGCKELIELDPKQSIPSEAALETIEDIEAGAFGAYAVLRKVSLYGRDLVAASEALADNTFHTNLGSLRDVYNNNPGAHLDAWKDAYEGINRANLVMAAIEEIDAPAKWKDSWFGQMQFIRALLYFNLSTIYGYDPTAIISDNNRGSVPIVEQGVINIDDLVLIPRAPITDMYDFLYQELDSAFEKLERGDVTTAPHRVTSAAVLALYSRVALFNGDYSKVVEMANKALEQNIGIFQSGDAYLGAWRSETHPESIFEVKFNINENVGANNSLRATYTTRAFLDDTKPSTHGALAVSDELLDLYEDGDVRRGLIIKGLGNNINRNEMTKFISRGGVKDLDNVPVFRISELFLNRAEAYYHLRREDLALEDVNKIRVRAGIGNTTASGSSLYEEILLQRRLEFAFEGHRWFDLKRLGRNIVKNGRTLPFADYRVLARVPYREINAYEGILRQNVGY